MAVGLNIAGTISNDTLSGLAYDDTLTVWLGTTYFMVVLAMIYYMVGMVLIASLLVRTTMLCMEMQGMTI